MLQTPTEEITVSQAWVIGSKLPYEELFFLQIVTTEKIKNRRESYLLGQNSLQWFIMEIDLPQFKKAEGKEPEIKQLITGQQLADLHGWLAMDIEPF